MVNWPRYKNSRADVLSVYPSRRQSELGNYGLLVVYILNETKNKYILIAKFWTTTIFIENTNYYGFFQPSCHSRLEFFHYINTVKWLVIKARTRGISLSYRRIVKTEAYSGCQWWFELDFERKSWIIPVRHTSRTNEVCNIECIIIIILDRSPKILSDILSD